MEVATLVPRCRVPMAVAYLLILGGILQPGLGCRQSEPDEGGPIRYGGPPVVPVGVHARARARNTLDTWLDEASVFVRSSDGTGSGFFVTRDLVLTNSHVVGSDQELRVYVHGAEGPLRGEVLTRTPKPAPKERDYAVVRVLRTDREAKNQRFLRLAEDVDRTDTVFAAGFPGVVCGSDKHCVEGDRRPEVVIRQGEVSAVVESPRRPGLNLVTHEAQTSSGDSGGPLIDVCGRVVGMTSFVTTGGAGGKANFALEANDLHNWLLESGVDSATFTKQGCP